MHAVRQSDLIKAGDGKGVSSSSAQEAEAISHLLFLNIRLKMLLLLQPPSTRLGLNNSSNGPKSVLR